MSQRSAGPTVGRAICAGHVAEPTARRGHRTVRCAPDMSGAPRKDGLRNSPASGFHSSRSAIIHRTVRCAPDSVRCAKEKRPHELASFGNRQQLVRYNSPDMSGVHRTVRCAIEQTELPTATFGGWGYKYPNHPTIHCIQVFHFPTTTRALAFNSRHTKEIKSSPIPHKTLVTRESDLPCSFELLRLDCFFSFSFFL